MHTVSDARDGRVERAAADAPPGLVFANLVDFDAKYGHRNDVAGYAANLERFDERLGELLPMLREDDLLDPDRGPRQRSDDAQHRSLAGVRAGAGLRRARARPAWTSACAPRSPTSARPWPTCSASGRSPAAAASWRRSRGQVVGERGSHEHHPRGARGAKHATLAPQAARSVETRGRLRPEPEDDFRPAFQRDRDRIIHCKAFRRLKHKTQVFFAPTGDHYRTRLTHTLEVAQIARTIAKALALNEELTEAIALGHDLGHTPFGHHGERVLAGLVPGGFEHYEQSLRIVDVLERDGAGLNLTWEIRDGIANHSKGKRGSPVGPEVPVKAATLEGQIARVADLDRVREPRHRRCGAGGLLNPRDLPAGPLAVLGATHSARIGCMVKDVVLATRAAGMGEIAMSEPVLDALLDLRAFMYAAVYENELSTAEFKKAAGILAGCGRSCGSGPTSSSTGGHCGARALTPRRATSWRA